MSVIEVKVPQLSESVAEATMLRWKKKAGEAVAVDEILIEIETDKVVLEVPAPSAGVLSEILQADGASVISNQVIARIDTDAVEALGSGTAGTEPELSAAARILAGISSRSVDTTKPSGITAADTPRSDPPATEDTPGLAAAQTTSDGASALSSAAASGHTRGGEPSDDELYEGAAAPVQDQNYEEGFASYAAAVNQPEVPGASPDAQAENHKSAKSVHSTSPTDAALAGRDVRLLGVSAATVATVVAGVLAGVGNFSIESATPYLAAFCLIAPSLLYVMKIAWKYLRERRRRLDASK
ncbi:Biotin-requiring enzyme [Variovorax sp. OK212]|jgi:pyruvate/2-oxoglutarate dehydrogenase complex dihydrolipoamide acyltransferase (E2) component|nr:Biotin-requiring enzyme [Variovorax sp. OK202]SFC88646.1 Biotin-requiring enzyme [Variovorax sp. OK212]